MIKGYWNEDVAVIGLAVLIAILVAAAISNSRYLIVEADSRHSQQHDPGNPGKPRSTVHEQSGAREYQPDCSIEMYADLCAQRRMADAAEKQARYTLVSTWLLGFTLAAAVAAAWYARRAAFAGDETVGQAMAANRIVSNDRRPWLDFTIEPNGTYQHSADSEFVTIDLRTNFVNHGTSPALNVFLRVAIVRTNRPFSLFENVRQIVADQTNMGGRDDHSIAAIFPNQKDPNPLDMGYGVRELVSVDDTKPKHFATQRLLIVVAFYRSVGSDELLYTADCFNIHLGESTDYDCDFDLSPAFFGRFMS